MISLPLYRSIHLLFCSSFPKSCSEQSTNGALLELPSQMDTPGVKITVRMLVGSKTAGGLIGKGGLIIKGFRDSSGAWIDVADIVHDAPKRVVTVRGSVSKVKLALQCISDR